MRAPLDPAKAIADPALTEPAVRAIKALHRGDANADQQRVALEFILHGLSGVDNLAFWPGDAGITAFTDGRRYVGMHLRRIILWPLKRLGVSEDEAEQPARRRRGPSRGGE